MDKKDTTLNPATDTPVEEPKKRSAQLRKWFFYILIGGLVVSALISIVAVLIGEINDVVARSLWTTVLMVVHALVGVGFLSAASNSKNSTADDVMLNTLVGLTVASFITAVLGTWEVVPGDIIGDLYQLYFYVLLASILVFCLLHARFSDAATALCAKISIGTTLAFLIYLVPSAFDNTNSLATMYYRGVAAFAILLSTLVIVTVIYQWVYAIKNRDRLAQERAQAIAEGRSDVPAPSSSMPTPVKVVLIVIGVLFGAPLAFGLLIGIIGAFARMV